MNKRAPNTQYAHELPLLTGERRPRPRNALERRLKREEAAAKAAAARIPRPHYTEVRKNKHGTELPYRIGQLPRLKSHRWTGATDNNGMPQRRVPRAPKRVEFRVKATNKAWVRDMGKSQPHWPARETRQSRRLAQRLALKAGA